MVYLFKKMISRAGVGEPIAYKVTLKVVLLRGLTTITFKMSLEYFKIYRLIEMSTTAKTFEVYNSYSGKHKFVNLENE
jgi:hypothetical protein